MAGLESVQETRDMDDVFEPIFSFVYKMKEVQKGPP